MALKPLQRWAYRIFGPMARKMGPERLAGVLQRARIPIRPEAFLANALANAILTLVVMLVFVAPVVLIIVPLLGPRLPVLVRLAPLMWMLPIFFAFIVYTLSLQDIGSKAKKRAKDINLKLPYALNYVAAMASAGVIPTEIFRSLGRQRIYGEVAKESASIYKDIGVHGMDIVTSLRRAIERSPSVKFQELMQGAVTTITSGGDLKAFFLEKAQRYQWENRQEQKAFIDTMGLMAETYVTVAVAGPLFMIVMMAIIAIITAAGPTNLAVLVYGLMPIINFGYVFLLQLMIPEV